ncbi:MAG: response regulator transcription factor [Edaphobacter sp.]|uniref:response regulator n=1 Tax=Edaphobacter sp. TaxID=1934404 RepID=UPI002398574D|nr:response regulator transcription factor [Edaphobacter sp.]MDE1176333.1 response regulator transcription factor [Edaphobacter sp.]
MPASTPIRVFVVDDHQVVRMGLKTMLESVPDIAVVGTSASPLEVIEKVSPVDVDVVLTDLRMAEMNGEEMIRRLHQVHPELRCAVLTNYHSDEDVFSAVKAGAMAYILKTASMEHVVTAIRTVHEGGRSIPPHIAQQLAERVARIELSVREREILQLVAQGMKNREIADLLYISEFTARNHVINLLEKLGTRDRTEATAVAIKRGLVRLEQN